MSRYKVLVTARSFSTGNGEPIKYLEENDCEVVRLKGDIPELLRQNLPQADAVIAGLEVYDYAMIESAPSLKVISRYGVGYDNVDLIAARDKGVVVTITPGANEDSVADLAMALMLSAARHVPFMDRSIRAGEQERPTGVEMWQKTLGVVGVGRIGKGVIKRAKGFEMRVLCFDMVQDLEFAKQYGVQYVDFDTLIRESDFITLHTPYNENTKNMVGAAQFAAMKDTAVLVNTARGGLIDEDMLYNALKNHKIGAAGLDVTLIEPPYSSALLTLDNCILTPHAGAATTDAVYRMSMMAAQNVVAVLKNGTCDYAVGKK